MPTPDSLPDYADTLRAFTRAFGRELRRVVRAVPVAAGSRVLDVPCGDGFYTAALARRMYPFGTVTAADLSDAYLDAARATVATRADLAAVKFVKADAYHLPFDDGAFDLVWCARSFISLDDPVAALREMRRVLRPGGTVAVLEDDEMHRVVVNWPINLELDLQRAVVEATWEKYGSRSGLSPARHLRRHLMAAGFRPRRRRTFAADRQAPFSPAVRDFLRLHLRETRAFVAKFLPPGRLADLDRAIDPAAPDSLLCRLDAVLTCFTTLFLATRD